MAAPDLIDRRLLAERRRRAVARATSGAGFLVEAASAEIGERLGAVKRRFDRALDLGGHTGAIARMLAASGQVGEVIRADSLVADHGAGRLDVVADEEAPPFAPESFDLVVSALTLHLVNDLPGALVQIRRALRPDGLLLATLPAAGTLFELSESLAAAEAEVTGGASPRVVPFADLQSLAGLLQRAGFALPVADLDQLTVRYDDMFALVRDLRAMAQTNPLRPRSRVPAPRALFARAAAIYGERFADPDCRVRATFAFASLSGWAPHESQQQPLRPGSAKARLADALGTQEVKLPRGGGTPQGGESGH